MSKTCTNRFWYEDAEAMLVPFIVKLKVLKINIIYSVNKFKNNLIVNSPILFVVYVRVDDNDSSGRVNSKTFVDIAIDDIKEH